MLFLLKCFLSERLLLIKRPDIFASHGNQALAPHQDPECAREFQRLKFFAEILEF